MNSFNSIDLMFKHPFTCLVAGPTGSGKTYFIRKLFNNFDRLININKDKVCVLWCFGIATVTQTIPLSNPNVRIVYINELINDELVRLYRPDIIVFDDFMQEGSKDKNLSTFFTRSSHHMNISIFFLVQNFFYQDKQMRNISLNSHYIVLMKNRRDQSQIMSLAKQLYPTKVKFLQEVYIDATKEPYGYLIIDVKPESPEELRMRTRIFPDEKPVIIYLPKNV